MKFIYSTNSEIAIRLTELGLVKLGEVTINGEKLAYFLNSRNVELTKEEKEQIILTNRIVFVD